MAKFKQNNVELRDYQKLILDSSKTKYISYDGNEVYINTTLSGVNPEESYHLTTKYYVDDVINTTSGTLQSNDDYLNTKLDTTSGTLQNQIDNIETIFGSEFHQASSEGESSTTSESYQQKLRLTTGSLPSGTYMIQWNYEYNGDTEHGYSRVELNDTTELHFNDYDSSIGDYIALSGFKVELLSGINTIDIDYRSNNAVYNMKIRRARIALWRIS